MDNLLTNNANAKKVIVYDWVDKTMMTENVLRANFCASAKISNYIWLFVLPSLKIMDKNSNYSKIQI